MADTNFFERVNIISKGNGDALLFEKIWLIRKSLNNYGLLKGKILDKYLIVLLNARCSGTKSKFHFFDLDLLIFRSLLEESVSYLNWSRAIIDAISK